MKIVMTGEKGLIGSFLKKRLEKEGYVIVMGCDLRDNKNVLDMKNKIINEKIDMVVHLAAHCKINQSIENPELAHVNNADGTFAVLEFCRKNKISKIMYFSSSRILNHEKNPYTSSKVYGEELCKGYKNVYGIDYLIIRPSTVYGPFWDKTKRLMHIFITNALEGKDIEIYGDPETKTLDFTYIDDFVDGTMLALNGEWNKKYNISGNEESNIFDLAKYIIAETGNKSKIVVKDKEISQPQEVSVDISEIKKLGYNPQVSLKEGTLKCIDWYKSYLGKT